jgi:hypothetical protein
MLAGLECLENQNSDVDRKSIKILICEIVYIIVSRHMKLI